MKVYLHVFKFDISDLFVCAIFPCLVHNVELQKYGTYKFIYNDEYYKFYLNKIKDVLYCIMTYKTNDEIFTYKFTLSLFNNGKLEHKSISYYISDLRLAIIYNIYNIFTNRDFYNNDQFIQNEDYMYKQIEQIISSIASELEQYKENYVSLMEELKQQEQAYDEKQDSYEVYLH